MKATYAYFVLSLNLAVTLLTKQIEYVMSLADKADRHALYQQTVQTPKKDVKFLYNTYLDIFRHKVCPACMSYCQYSYYNDKDLLINK